MLDLFAPPNPDRRDEIVLTIFATLVPLIAFPAMLGV
jgi:hypothetical protein